MSLQSRKRRLLKTIGSPNAKKVAGKILKEVRDGWILNSVASLPESRTEAATRQVGGQRSASTLRPARSDGLLYVLDAPSIGLPRDTEADRSLRELRVSEIR